MTPMLFIGYYSLFIGYYRNKNKICSVEKIYLYPFKDQTVRCQCDSVLLYYFVVTEQITNRH
jgi:hypothetical protein